MSVEPRFAKTYRVEPREGLFIDDELVPWYIAMDPEWRVQPMSEHHHILWLPVLIDGPCPEYGEPDGMTPTAEPARTQEAAASAAAEGDGGMSESTQAAEIDALPKCCGDDMVSYMGGWFFECSDAFFRLQDDGGIEDDGSSPPRLIEPASDEHKALHEHLLSTRQATCEVCGQRSLTQRPDGSIMRDCPRCYPPGGSDE